MIDEQVEQVQDDAIGRAARYMEMRAVTIRYLRMIEDELIQMRAIRPQDRACLTRQERRALLIVDIEPEPV